jgi:hypothetical protein
VEGGASGPLARYIQSIVESSAVINSQECTREKSAPRIINNLKRKPLQTPQKGQEKRGKEQAWHGFYTYDYQEGPSSEEQANRGQGREWGQGETAGGEDVGGGSAASSRQP